MNLLNSHPHVYCGSDLQTEDVERHGENWAYEVGMDYPETPGRVAPKGTKKPRIVGYLVKTKHNIHQKFYKRSGLKVIFLTRTNKLAMLLSYRVCQIVGTYPDVRKEVPPLVISQEDARAYFEEWEGREYVIRRDLEGADWTEITYEHLCKDPWWTMSRVYGHLGVHAHDPHNTEGRGSEKLETRPLSEAIKNYDSLKRFFAGSRWERYFEEESW